jgi:hypothetical protein
MLHGSPSRASRPARSTAGRPGTHRRRADGGPAAGQHRPAPPLRTRPVPSSGEGTLPGGRTLSGGRALSGVGTLSGVGAALALPRAAVRPLNPQRAAQFLTKSLAILIVLGVTGLVAFFIVASERRGVPAEASTTPVGVLDTRAGDPVPLTLQEVFPDPAEVHPPGGAPAYRITMTHIDSDCRIAAYGTLGGLLADRGCSQVVRASLTAPYGDYQVTTGLFNLTDVAGATALDDQLRNLVETGDGSFAAMAAGEPGTDPSTPPAAQVGWHSSGHYLLYCVITRPGGAVVPNDDPNAARITADLVDGYLGATVLGRRGTTA